VASAAPTSVVEYGHGFLPVSRRESESPNGEIIVQCKVCMEPGEISRACVLRSMNGRYRSGSNSTLTSLRYLPGKSLLGLNFQFSPETSRTMDSYFVGHFCHETVEFRSQVMMAEGATITRDR
jgi:hypothetical protein